MSFVHLHVHSEYSWNDGACFLEKLVKRAKQLKMPAVAITDRNSVAGAVKFTHLCNQAGIKPIIGTEISVVNDLSDGKTYSLILLAQTRKGFDNLSLLISYTYKNDHQDPKITKSVLQQHSQGIICLSFSVRGELGTLLLEDNSELARETIKWYKTVFGDRYYLELQNHGLPAEAYVMPKILDLARETKTQLVLTNDCHYMNRRDSIAIDALHAIRHGLTFKSKNCKRFDSNEYYFKTYSEMKDAFSFPPQAIKNTVKIAERIDFDITQKLIRDTTDVEIEDHYDSVKNLISEFGFIALKDKNSANLYIPKGKTTELIELISPLFENYQIVPVSYYRRLSPKELISEVVEVFDVKDKKINQLIDLMPKNSNSIIDAILNSVDFSVMSSDTGTYDKITTLAMSLEGIFRQIGNYASVYTIIPRNCAIPLLLDTKGKPTTQFDRRDLEAMGYPTLTIFEIEAINHILDSLAQINKTKHNDLSLATIPLNDKITYEYLSQGNTKNIYLLDSEKAQEQLRQFKPDDFLELTVFIALNAINNNKLFDKYIKNRSNKHKYEHPILKNILAETHGILIYREQISEIAKQIAAFSEEGATELRRAILKNKKKEIQRLTEKYTIKGQKNGIPGDAIDQSLKYFKEYSRFVFPRCHASILTMIAYHNAWIKANFCSVSDEMLLGILKDKENL